MKTLITLFFIPTLVWAGTQVTIGTGTATKDGKPIYTEKHTVTWDDAANEPVEALTEYSDMDGKLIATMKSNFSKSVTNPEHEMHDLRDDRRYGVRYEGEQAIMWDQKKGEKERKEKLKKGFAGDRLVIGGQGLHYYMRKRMDEMKQGKLAIALLIPGRMDWFGFLVEYVGEKEGRREFYAKAQSFFLRLFAPSLSVWYSPAGDLLEFQGPSNLTDQKGDVQNVRITYDKPLSGPVAK